MYCNASVIIRRPNMVRFLTLMPESVDVLEKSPNAALTERRMFEWVRLQRIMSRAFWHAP